jgi:hypothetical protein
MSFQCSELDDALGATELPPEAKAHADGCEHCRERIELWSEISELAPELHEEWDSPSLWPRIQSGLEASTQRQPFFSAWKLAFATAAALLLAVALFRPWTARQPDGIPQNAPFLTAETLSEVQKAEAAYVQAIEKLSTSADTTLQTSPTALAAMYREKLILLDSAIADLQAGVQSNRYNVYLQTQLASLYQEKQKTLEEWLKNAKSN